jgi:hypothetical protein
MRISPLRAPRLHLNEHLSPDIAIQLRRRGFDVTSSQEADLLRASDTRQLEFAISQQRAILTTNFSDFVVLHEEYLGARRQHWGIVLTTQEPIWFMMRCLLRMLGTISAAELRNQLRWLNEFKPPPDSDVGTQL